MAPRKDILSPLEQRIEDEIGRGEWKPVSEKEKAEFLAALGRKVASLRGGPRPNAGRKPLGNVHLGVNIKPETRAVLIEAAGGKSRGIGAVLDEWARKMKGKRKRVAVS